MKRAALGKGLSALLPDTPTSRGGSAELPIDDLRPNPLQPRRVFGAAALDELAASIRQHGLLQPLVVSRAQQGGYVLIAGERRWRAARLAGLKRVPVVIREIGGDEEMIGLALVENLIREDLTPIEEARAYHHLRAEIGLSQEEIAARVGKDRSTVANSLRLLTLPLAIQELVDAGTLSAGHARVIAGLGDAGAQQRVAQASIAGGWSVRELERRSQTPMPRARRAVDPETAAATDRLSLALGARVEIHRRRRGGDLRISFSSEQELIRLFKALSREDS